jgi:hypothetical protein
MRFDEVNTMSRADTPTVLVLAAWLVVCVPAGWGIYNTALNAAKLFSYAKSPAVVNLVK